MFKFKSIAEANQICSLVDSFQDVQDQAGDFKLFLKAQKMWLAEMKSKDACEEAKKLFKFLEELTPEE
jgi:hypothetical protein